MDSHAALQSLIDATVAAASPLMRENFVHPDWVMSAAEFDAYWAKRPMAAFCTVSPTGRPRIAPIEPVYAVVTFTKATFRDAARLRDLAANPHAALVSWTSPYEVAVIYGAAVVEEEDGGAMVTVRLTPERIYAVRPPAGHEGRQPA
jgi:hypothetical protein